MIVEVARVYRFFGRHHVPGLPEPWCHPHHHDYTVEVIARGEAPVVVDTDLMDEAWRRTLPPTMGVPKVVDLDKWYGPSQTTVEALAATWLVLLRSDVPRVHSVTVREDDQRWGCAQLD